MRFVFSRTTRRYIAGSALCGKSTRDYIFTTADLPIRGNRRHHLSTAWWEAAKLLLAYQVARMLFDCQQARRQHPTDSA